MSKVGGEASGERRLEETRVGLCATCLHARRIESSRGSTFFLCERSRTDPRFRKYPPLPVRTCAGYEEESAR